ncbi:MAG: FAD-dependent oxidoreductase [Chloroflexi bacterium]|nr:FAD-dependent oxidoreductase [Chloroflexota bacterium]
MKVVIIGGGAGGFSAATVARATGADVTLIERTDMLGGIALVAGVAMLNGMHSAIAEERALGGAVIYDLFDSIIVRRDLPVPGLGDKASFYNVSRLDAAMQRELRRRQIEFMLGRRAVNVDASGSRVEAVVLEDGTRVKGDAFIDATGSTDSPSSCHKWGWGCVECILRCPAFGPTGGIVEKMTQTYAVTDDDGRPGKIGASVLIAKESLSAELQNEIRAKGFAVIPVPQDAEPDLERASRMPANRPGSGGHVLAGQVFKENLIITDIGAFVKIIGVASPLYAGSLRKFHGLEDATIVQPAAGARGHLVSLVTMAPRDNTMKVDGFPNLFCAGVKAGPGFSIGDAVVTGDLAGYNAARCSRGQDFLELPKNLMAGAYIDLLRRNLKAAHEITHIHEIKVLQELGVYRVGDEVVKEVQRTGLPGVFKARQVS